MKTEKSIVPWKNPEQFQKVYKYIYSDDITKKRWAVEQMTVWETRCWPSLPTAVEVTLLLVRSKIQDMLFEADKSLYQAQEVEMLYSAAVIRFVNLVLEIDQSGGVKVPLVDIAEKKNIPLWIVDVRHNAIHGLGPSLAVLRLAYEAIMSYLEKSFWSPESTRVCSIKKFFFDNTNIVKLLQDYRSVQYEGITNEFKKKRMLKMGLAIVLHHMELLLNKPNSRREFLNVLVHPDNCVTKEDVNLILHHNFLKTDANNQILPIVLQKLWDPLIQLLHKNNCIPTFLELLQLSQENRKIRIFQKIVDYLVLYILDLATPNQDKMTDLRHSFSQKGPFLNWNRLLYCCMKGSSAFSMIVFNNIAQYLNLDNWREELSILLTMKQGLTLQNKEESSRSKKKKRKYDITFTVGDLEEDIQSEVTSINPSLKDNRWFLSPIDMNFSDLPLGYVFNPVKIERKEIPKIEIESPSTATNDKFSTVVHEDCVPIVVPESKIYIFDRLPAESSMIYRKNIN